MSAFIPVSLRLLFYAATAFMLACILRAEAAPPAEFCEWAARQVAQETGVPFDILGALTLTETGRRLDGATRPWAWSVNSEGQGSWFDDPESAISYASSRLAEGRDNLDIGCFQLNYRWHGQHFHSVSQMFDPLENARYAARFVTDLYIESGDWRKAAGMFHSRTRSHADRYLARFDTLRSLMRSQGFQHLLDSPETYNRFAIAPSDTPRSRVFRERAMLLGAPLGSAKTGAAGSLAVIANAGKAQLTGAAGPIISVAPSSPLIGGSAARGLFH